jgi:hypothetical protein
MEILMHNPTPPEEKHYEIARDLLIHIEGQASLAVMKSTLLLAAHTLLGGAYLQVASFLKVFERPIATRVEFSFVLAGILLLAALLLSLLSILPRLKAQPETSLLFFAGIAVTGSPSAFVTAFKKTEASELETLMLANIYGKSVWLLRTFRLIQLAIICSLLGTILCVITFAHLNIHLQSSHQEVVATSYPLHEPHIPSE